jgi:hypothetical protein
MKGRPSENISVICFINMRAGQQIQIGKYISLSSMFTAKARYLIERVLFLKAKFL